MGRSELIEALRREGEEKRRSIRRQAEEEADRIRRNAAEEIERLRQELRDLQAAAVRERCDALLSEARRKARMLLLAAHEELSERLRREAFGSLDRLREGSYADVFRGLVAELPAYRWQVVTVNPEDEEMAKGYFPEAEIISDSGISGGLDVAEKGGAVRIVNTFEKRLENLWEDFLPELIRDVCEKTG